MPAAYPSWGTHTSKGDSSASGPVSPGMIPGRTPTGEEWADR